MNFEEIPVKNSKGLAKRVKVADIDKLGTWSILWLLIKRHKFGLVSVWAISITALYFFPFLPDLVASLFM